MKAQNAIVLANPLKRGYSRATVTANIRELMAANVRSGSQAVAIALSEARKAYRKRHARGPFPAHLALNVNPKSFKFGPGASSITKKAHGGVVTQDKTPTYIVKSSGRKRGVINRNPLPKGRNYRKAVALYKDFTGHDPKFVDDWDVTIPSTALQVGHVTGILYKTRMDGKMQEFMHEFTGKSRPILAASADGRQLLLLGGDYKFTERGIVDGTFEIRK